MVVIIDYEMGNVGSVRNAVEALGCKAIISRNKRNIIDATQLILPGVGSFGSGIQNLYHLGLVDVLTEVVLGHSKPFLGICLGMQLLAEQGEEGGMYKGLGWVKGTVRKIKAKQLPHVGWNDVFPREDAVLFKNIKRPIFYFAHSYCLPSTRHSIVAAEADYGEKFVAAIHQKNIFGVQFHPEKSQQEGLKILDNFLKYNE